MDNGRMERCKERNREGGVEGGRVVGRKGERKEASDSQLQKTIKLKPKWYRECVEHYRVRTCPNRTPTIMM